MSDIEHELSIVYVPVPVHGYIIVSIHVRNKLLISIARTVLEYVIHVGPIKIQ